MGFEIPIDVDYFEHPKTLKLIAILKRPEADIYPLRLWRWATLYAKKGVIEGAEQLEQAVRWRGAPGALHKAMMAVGLLEKDGRTIHDWMKGVGAAIYRYEQKKQRQRELYRQSSGSLPEEFRHSAPIQQQHTLLNSTLEDSDKALSDDVAKKINYKASLLLLLSIEVKESKAKDLALTYPWGRIAEVVRASSGRENPGGWAIKALSEMWAVPNPFTPAELAALGKNGQVKS